jgi:hypothetical protein
VKERRQMKLEKKQAAAARKQAAAKGDPTWGLEDEHDSDAPTRAVPSPPE